MNCRPSAPAEASLACKCRASGPQHQSPLVAAGLQCHNTRALEWPRGFSATTPELSSGSGASVSQHQSPRVPRGFSATTLEPSSGRGASVPQHQSPLVAAGLQCHNTRALEWPLGFSAITPEPSSGSGALRSGNILHARGAFISILIVISNKLR